MFLFRPFRLVRTVVVIGIAFLAGMLAERGHQNALCEKSGGQWMRSGFCVAEDK